MDTELQVFKNENPTETEKRLYLYAGFYKIEDEYCEVNGIKTDLRYLKYAVCYTENSLRKTFPERISISQKYIDYKSLLIFNSMSEEVQIHGSVDMKILNLIIERAKELGWGTVSKFK